MNNVESCMENGQLVVRQAKPKHQYCHWLGICAITLLVATTVFFALLHFEIIPGAANKEEFEAPEFSHFKTVLDSMPPVSRALASKERKLAAHLTGMRNGNEIRWQGESLNSLLEDGMKLKNNALVIPRDGLYFVYTQVVYTGSTCINTNTMQLTHTVRRHSVSTDDQSPILTSTKTACEVHSKSTWFQPMYQGGLFHLEKGDVLSTTTTNVNHLDTTNGKSYFGILAF
uniref:Lymphotoxin-alpha n=1 Tax=Leptobrachium leishanense TaxID=445787 RepID=A0A8C5MKC3_9ANUR